MYNIFLGGPITSMIDLGGQFNLNYKNKINYLIQNLSKISDISSAYIDENYGERILDDDRLTTKRDLQWIDRANICIFMLPFDSYNDMFFRSDGMFVEIGYAVSKCKKVIIFTEPGKIERLSPMIKGLIGLSVVFEDINDISFDSIKKLLDNM